MKKSNVLVLCHGRHVETVGWETLVWGEGDKIGTAPLALALAFQTKGHLVFGTGASERDGLKECAFTRKLLKSRLAQLIQFPEFAGYRSEGAYELDALFSPTVADSYLDEASQNTDQEVMNALKLAKLLGVTELIQVTSTFHAPRCSQAVGKLIDDDYDFGGVICKMAQARSSTVTCQAATTVILEFPHRGDDEMIKAPLKPHQVFPRMFRLRPPERMQFFSDTSDRLTELGV